MSSRTRTRHLVWVASTTHLLSVGEYLERLRYENGEVSLSILVWRAEPVDELLGDLVTLVVLRHVLGLLAEPLEDGFAQVDERPIFAPTARRRPLVHLADNLEGEQRA